MIWWPALSGGLAEVRRLRDPMLSSIGKARTMSFWIARESLQYLGNDIVIAVSLRPIPI